MDFLFAELEPTVYLWFTKDQWINVSVAVITAFIGVLAYVIVHKQNRIISTQSKIQLFTERYQIYEATLKFLAIFIQNFEIDTLATREFNILRSRAAFLYGDEVNGYLKEIYVRAIDIHCQNTEIEQLNENGRQGLLTAEQEKERRAIIKKNSEAIKWICDQIEAAKLTFKDYIDLARIK